MVKILVAYPYMTDGVVDLLKSNKDEIDLIVDSGAFTAWKAGKVIKIDDYMKFLSDLPIKPEHYLTLDVIGNPKASLDNYNALRSSGFTPVPVFTRGDHPDMIEVYYETSDLIAVGGLVGTQGNGSFVRAFMKKAKGRKVHWLGFGKFAYLKTFKPYSCDSTAYSRGRRFGELDLYVGHGQWERYKNTEDGRALLQSHIGSVQRIRSFGVDPERLASSSGWRGKDSSLHRLGIMSYMHYSRDLFRNVGSSFFLACGPDDVKMAISCSSFLKRKSS